MTKKQALKTAIDNCLLFNMPTGVTKKSKKHGYTVVTTMQCIDCQIKDNNLLYKLVFTKPNQLILNKI